jgi:RHS repeat-associated protein
LYPPSQFTYGYEPNSYNLLKTLTGPAHTATNTWEATRNVLASKTNKVGTSLVSGYSYGVNLIGQRDSLATTGTGFDGSTFASTTATGPSFGWSYNTRGELVEANDTSTANNDRAYQFDGIGNREKTVDGLFADLQTAPDNYTPNALNQYTVVNAFNPTHDADGNQIDAQVLPLGSSSLESCVFAWDAENRLTSATVNGTTTSYHYDALSRRISMKVGSSTSTLYIHDGWNLIAKYAGTTLNETYTWGMDLSGSMQGAGGVGGILAVTDGSASYYPTYDGNGNVSEYLDSTGAVKAHYEYDPFGKTTVATGAKAADFSHRFSTKPLDTETGLYYYGYRYYDPQTGRWPSRDPIKESGGINIYGYVDNDSINLVDILGMWFANGAKNAGAKLLNAEGTAYLDGNGGYTEDYDQDSPFWNLKPTKAAIMNHEELHSKLFSESDNAKALPYKQLFCKNKKYYYYTAEANGKDLLIKEWTAPKGPNSGLAASKKSLLWPSATRVYQETESELAIDEVKAHIQEIEELLGKSYKSFTFGETKPGSGIYDYKGDGEIQGEGLNAARTRVSITLLRSLNNHSNNINNTKSIEEWDDFRSIHIKERAENDDFSFPIPEIIHSRLLQPLNK